MTMNRLELDEMIYEMETNFQLTPEMKSFMISKYVEFSNRKL